MSENFSLVDGRSIEELYFNITRQGFDFSLID